MHSSGEETEDGGGLHSSSAPGLSVQFYMRQLSKTKYANVVFVSDSFQGNCMQTRLKQYQLPSGLTVNSVYGGGGGASVGRGGGIGKGGWAWEQRKGCFDSIMK
ncbi:unnamed protein product [Pipistrellus nathusii]|uniref:Uncharacterized protein n=1 Tax=Pipistrellus nathusii TaxID=59473 RepID=A0ABP0AG45_PIPNA